MDVIVAQVSNDMILKSAMPPQTLKDTDTDLTEKSAHDLRASEQNSPPIKTPRSGDSKRTLTHLTSEEFFVTVLSRQPTKSGHSSDDELSLVEGPAALSSL
jgi:hypothetical protein